MLPKLKELNERVNLVVFNGELTEDVLKTFKVVVMTDSSSMDEVVRINDFCHKEKICFISSDVPGLFGYIFVDFGEEFTTQDADGEMAKTCFIAGITKDEEGVVTIVDGSRHDLETGDHIKITEVQGMEEVNGKEFEVTVLGKCGSPWAFLFLTVFFLGPTQFKIGDTSKFGEYTKGGFISQVKQPKSLSFVLFILAL